MVLALGLMAGFASTALATPGQANKCSNCHGLLGTVTISATPVSFTDTSTTYHIAVNNPLGIRAWAVFSGSLKLAGASSNGSDVVLPDGITYNVYGVSGDGTGGDLPNAGYAVTSVSPKFPDHTAPTTTSDAKATYVGSATVHLLAADNNGGSGVAHTYYILDSSAQAEGIAVSTSVLGTHTLEFWSVDASANIETPHNFANFTVTAAPALRNYVYKFNLKKKSYKGLKAVLVNNITHVKTTVTVSKKGVATFKNMPVGTYKLSTTGNKKFKFKAKTITIS